jgi:hypothetical protein
MADSRVGEVLFDRFAKLHHAINLRDFEAYCKRRAVLSRSELTRTTSEYTAFYTDDSDKELGLWERVFGNLQDFGALFWVANACTPNAYGPITLIFTRDVWSQVADIGVSRRGAASKDFKLATERMPACEIETCFEMRDKKWWRLTCDGLEVSVGTSFLSHSFVEKVVVEPVLPHFVDKVRMIWTASGQDGSLVVSRTDGIKGITPERQAAFDELVKWSAKLAGNVPRHDHLKTNVPARLKEWASGLRETQWPPLRQWLEYTFNGTLK